MTVTSISLPGSRRTWLIPSLLFIGVILAYLPVILTGGFIWDDDAYVQNNKVLTAPDGFARIWTDASATPQYYPVVFTTFYIERGLWGLHPLGFHVVNILLHAGNAVLVWLILRRLKIPGAALAAGLFALHPVMVESVAWITERKNVLALFCYLLSMFAYLRFEPELMAQSGRARRWAFWILSFAIYLVALGSKSVASALPFSLLVVAWYCRGTLRWRQILPLIPFMIVGIAAGMHTAQLERTHVGAFGSDWQFTLAERGLIAGRALLFYPTKLLFPWPLIFVYPRWTINPAAWMQYLFPLTALALLILAFAGARRWGRGAAAAALFYLINIGPALGFINLYPMRYSFVADHFQYVASLGVLTGIAALLTVLGRRMPPHWRLAGACALLLILGALTFKQGFVYQNLETLWTDTIRKNPSAWLALDNLGIIEVQSNRLDAGIAHLEKAVALKPKANLEGYTNLGYAYFKTGQIKRAEETLLEGLDQEGEPSVRAADANTLAAIYASQNDMPHALDYFSKAVELDPKSARNLANLARAELATGREADARKHLQAALQIDPHNSSASDLLAKLNTASAPAVPR